MSKRGSGPIDIGDVDRIFDNGTVNALADLLPVNNLDRTAFREMVRGDARIFAQSVRAPDVNDLRKQILKLEDAGRACDAAVVGILLDDLYSENRLLLEPRWDRLRPGAAFPSSKDLAGTRTDEICALVASICRDGGGFVEGHLRRNGKRSREWKALLHAPLPDQNVVKVAAEQELVRNLSLTWLLITDRPAPDIVHRRSSSAFARFVKRFFELVGTKASAIRLITKHGQQRRLPLFVQAAIWKWRTPSETWSSLPARFGDWKLIENRFAKWPEENMCRLLFEEMETAGRSDAAIVQTIVQITQEGEIDRSSVRKKMQRKRLKTHKKKEL